MLPAFALGVLDFVEMEIFTVSSEATEWADEEQQEEESESSEVSLIGGVALVVFLAVVSLFEFSLCRF